MVTPGIAGSGVEQDAHRGEVDGATRAFEIVCSDPSGKLAPPIDTAGGKMPPATVIGNFQVGIGLARDVGHIARHGREAAFIEREVAGTTIGYPPIDHAAALAHRSGIKELAEFQERCVPSRGR